MKTTILTIISFLLAVSCTLKKGNVETDSLQAVNLENLTYKDFIADYDLISVVNDKFIGKDSFQVVNWPNGNPKTKGQFALNKKGEMTLFKVGEFEEYFLNGNLKTKGSYEIGKYTQCCFSGLCSQFYNYKIGEWKYFFESGNLKTKVDYEVKEFPIGTSCEGGDTINFGQINLRSIRNMNDEGKQIEISNDYLKRLETVVFKRSEYNAEAILIEGNKAILDLIHNEDK